MNKIKDFVDSIFEGLKMTEELEDQKEELILNMTDRFNELVEDGKSNEQAYKEVVSNFGSIEEIKEELNISQEELPKKSTPKSIRTQKRKPFIFGILIVVTIVAGVFIKQYKNNRNYLSQDLLKLGSEINIIRMYSADSNTDNDYSIAVIREALVNLNKLHTFARRDLNFIETKKYNQLDNQFFLNGSIIDMHTKLKLRKQTGYWGTVDEEVYKRYVKLSDDMLYLIEKERFELDGRDIEEEAATEDSFRKFKSFIAILDVKAINDMYKELNELANCYVRYTQLPEDVTIMTKEEIIKILKNKFGEDIEVEFPSYGNNNIKAFNGLYEDITIVGEDYSLRVSIDAYKGYINPIMSRNNSNAPEEESAYEIKTVNEIIKRIFDDKADYQITSIKNTDRYQNDTEEFYSYQVVPFYYGYPIYYGNGKPEIYIDQNNIKAIHYFGPEITPSIEEIGETKITYNEEDALINALENQIDSMKKKFDGELNLSNFKYNKTAYIKSFATGKYDMMHIYDYDYSENEEQLYIHAENGIVE